MSFHFAFFTFFSKIIASRDISQKLKKCTFKGGFRDVPATEGVGTFSMLKRMIFTFKICSI